jgi:hypothetical protein
VWAGRDVAVRAFQVAPACEIPGDHVGNVVVARLWLREGMRLSFYRECPIVPPLTVIPRE